MTIANEKNSPNLLLALIFSTGNAQSYEKKIDSLIQKAIRLNRFNGSVLVCKNGKVIYEKAFGYQDAEKKIANTSNTVYQIGSTTKEFIAGVILKLAEQKKLSMDDKLTKYFPEFKRGDEIRIAFKNENKQATKITITEGLRTKQGDRTLNAVKPE